MSPGDTLESPAEVPPHLPSPHHRGERDGVRGAVKSFAAIDKKSRVRGRCPRQDDCMSYPEVPGHSSSPGYRRNPLISQAGLPGPVRAGNGISVATPSRGATRRACQWGLAPQGTWQGEGGRQWSSSFRPTDSGSLWRACSWPCTGSVGGVVADDRDRDSTRKGLLRGHRGMTRPVK